jgi:hypothetical protein
MNKIYKLYKSFILYIFVLVFIFFGAHKGKNIVFRFIIKYNSLMDFGLHVVGLFLYEDF